MPNTLTRTPKQSFTSTMNVYSRSWDHDTDWVIGNTAHVFKLGGDGELTVGDTQTATLGTTAGGFMKVIWFIAPFNMIVTEVSGAFQDDDMLSHLAEPLNYAGIWSINGFATVGPTPGDTTGTQTFELKYITTGVYQPNGYLSGWSWYDPGLSFTLARGDAIFAGTYIPRSTTNDEGTLTMTLCGEKN